MNSRLLNRFEKREGYTAAGEGISALRGGSAAISVSGANAGSGLKLSKHLASEQQVGQVGEMIAGGNTGVPLRKA